MARNIEVASGIRGIALLNGLVIDSGDEVVVSDQQFILLAGLISSGALIDNGHTDDPPTQGSDYTEGDIVTRLTLIEASIADPDSGIAALVTRLDDHDTLLDEITETVDEWLPGTELGFAERFTDFVANNTSASNVTTAKIDSFSATVTGRGRPVSIEFYAPQARHATAAAFVVAYLIVNGVAQVDNQSQNAVISSPVNATGRVLYMRRRMVLTEDVEYTFEVGVFGQVAGNITLDADADTPIELSVTAR